MASVGEERERDAAGTRLPIRGRTAAIGLTLVLLLLLSVLAGLLVWQTYRDTIVRAETRAESAAHVVAAHVQWLFEASTQALWRVDEALGDRPDVFLEGTVGDLDEAVGALPEQVVVWVFDADGDSVLTNDANGGELNVADRDYFRALRGGEAWHITPLLTARGGGYKAFGIGHRIERDGEFLGVAIIGVPARLMSDFWAPLDLGRDSSVGLLRDDGWLVARHPVPEATIDLRDHVLFTEYLPASPSGSYSYPSSPADGVGRIVGYRRVANAPLVAVAGISRDTVLSGFWSRLGIAAAIAAPVALALVMMSLWVAVLLRRDERTRQKLAAALEHNRFLFREIHHRVKNNLQTVSSLIRLQGGPPEAREEMTRRLAAMAAVHEHIYRSDQFAAVNLGEYLEKLVEELKKSHATPVSVSCRLAPVETDADRALSLGLIANEVISNAFKHAFPDGRAGSLSVELERLADGQAQLRIRDDGVGFESAEPVQGMGGRLVEALSRQIGGDYALRRDGGTAFVLNFPP